MAYLFHRILNHIHRSDQGSLDCTSGVDLYYWCKRRPGLLLAFIYALRFTCKLSVICLWACLDSNQGPLPYQGESVMSQTFAVVKISLQTGVFALPNRHSRSQLFVWVGVLMVYTLLAGASPLTCVFHAESVIGQKPTAT
jgi:hypothetical protein